MKLLLKRGCTSDDGTFGILSLDGTPLCVTCEDPWLNNKPNVSCIPKGTYKCVPHNGTAFKNVWRLENVPNRSAILIHAGNTEDDTHGCILVGKEIGVLTGKPAVLKSQQALAYLRTILPDKFEIEIL